MSNHIPVEKTERAFQLFREGKSIREVAKELGIAKETARSVRIALEQIIAEVGDEPLPRLKN